ncbi:hypothetical protein [Oligoflexus tunisiensis]|uniref:hypothetical protein n=1 Tax=Oligoflexus tunisiensis TaxID=708132 RepID=UPI00114CA59F|nr:hypothetical protein [Oligoflexus tunisiensis]
MTSRHILAATSIILQGIIYTTGCGFLCESEHCRDWQTAQVKTCRATVALPDVDFPIRAHLRVVMPKEILFQPQEQWEPSLNEQRPVNDGSLHNRLRDFGVSCHSNLFSEILVENYPVEKLSDSICRLTFPDDQATQFDLSWNAKTQVGKAVIQTQSATPETIEVPRGVPDRGFMSLATQNFEFTARTLHFSQLPIEVEYQQRIEDGYDATHPDDTGVRYRYSCEITNLRPLPGMVDVMRNHSRDEIVLTETCSISRYQGFFDQRVEITPEIEGIKVRVLNSQNDILDENIVATCEYEEQGKKQSRRAWGF